MRRHRRHARPHSMTNMSNVTTPDKARDPVPTFAVILPRREVYQKAGAGAVSLCVRDITANSRYRDSTLVFGEPVAEPLEPPRLIPVTPSPWIFMRRASRYLAGVIKALRNHPAALIEIHNRPIYVDALHKAFPGTPLLLYLHNDPRTMRGLKEASQRRHILEKVAAVVCVSDFIRRCMLDGLQDHPQQDKVQVVLNGVDTSLIRPVAGESRRKEIVFVGRLVPEKGGLLFARAAVALRQRLPEWRFVLIGARRLSPGGSKYGSEVVTEMERLGDQGEITGYIRRDHVMGRMARASIAVIPSLWDDPCPLTAIEAMSSGCAVVASNRGGLPEIVDEAGLMFSPRNVDELIQHLFTLPANPYILEQYQRLARQRAERALDIRRCAARLDSVRRELTQMEEVTG